MDERKTKNKMSKIIVQPFNNAVRYKLKNRRMSVIKFQNNGYIIETKILLKLNDDEKKEYLALENKNSKLVQKENSKYCIWFNSVCYSEEAMLCLYNFQRFIDDLNIAEESKSTP